MEQEIDAQLSTLRDRMIDTAGFRAASRELCTLLVQKLEALLQSHGVPREHVMIVSILRAGLAFLEPAVRLFPDAPVGILGMKRDERTLHPHWYYENLPPLSEKNAVVILDPMLATGGSAEAAIERLEEHGADPKLMYFVGVVAAPVGYRRLAKLIPREHIVLAAIDETLDDNGMIVPGVGDFGDRYFGHSGRARIGQ